MVLVLSGCNTQQEKENTTHVTIQGEKWYFNDQVINPGSPAEGLLMNVRMVNAVFEDRADGISQYVPDFDTEANTNAFIAAIPQYVASGVNAFTLCLQGGAPGYEGAVNTAFNPDGSLRDEYLKRVERVVRSCSANGAAVILSCFYQRQHSHFSALSGKNAIITAFENTVKWIAAQKFTNVVLEVSNEYRHGGFRNWPDGEWLISDEAQVDLMKSAKKIHPELLVSTSGMGTGLFNDPLASEADFLLIHFNNTSLEDIPAKINELKKFGKPIVCNEDDKLKAEGAIACALSVMNGAGWGFMNAPKNQRVPFEFEGVDDDEIVYGIMKNLVSPGFQIDPSTLGHTAINITYPNDGDIFRAGEQVELRISHLNPDESVPYSIEIFANGESIIKVGNRLIFNWLPPSPGIYVFEAVVTNDSGVELYRSAKVDIIVKGGN